MRICTVEGCGNKHLAKGFCKSHYGLLRKTLPDGPPPPAISTCQVAGCERPHLARGLCNAHYKQVKLKGKPGAVRLYGRAACGVEGCTRPHVAVGLCALHYNRQLKSGDTGPAGLRQREWGEGTLNSGGYVYVRRSVGGRVVRAFVHRLVMEEMLGRPLLPNENVHHRNGIKTDNRPENLEVWVRSQPCGQRPGDLMRFLAATYPQEFQAIAEEMF